MIPVGSQVNKNPQMRGYDVNRIWLEKTYNSDETQLTQNSNKINEIQSHWIWWYSNK